MLRFGLTMVSAAALGVGLAQAQPPESVPHAQRFQQSWDEQAAQGDSRPVPEMLASAQEMTASEFKELVSWLRPRMYMLIWRDEGPVQVVQAPHDGLVRIGQNRFGEVVRQGEIIQRGLIWNTGNDPIRLSLLDEDQAGSVDIPTGGLVSVGFISNEPGLVPMDASVSCADGYWACCWHDPNTGTAHAQCFDSNQPIPFECVSGGEGATSCSLTDK